MTIDALPVAPNRLEPETFATRSDAFVSALVTLVSQINAESLIMLGYSENANTKSDLATAQATKAERFAGLMGEAVETGLYSSKEHAVGVLTASGGSAKAWATSATSPDGTSSKSAKTLAAEALTSANNAADSASAAAATLEVFEDQWLGAKASEPSVDNDGNPLTEGVMYYNTTTHLLRIFNGLIWQNALGSLKAEFNIFRQVITATAGQTVFPLFNRYEVGTNSIAVYKNGSRLLLTSQYAETNDNTITVVTPATAGDKYLFETGTTTTGSAVAASLVTLLAVVGLAATNVQDAIIELNNDKAEKDGTNATGNWPINSVNVTGVVGVANGGTGASDATAAYNANKAARFTTSTSANAGQVLVVGKEYALSADAVYARPLPGTPAIGDTIKLYNSDGNWDNEKFTLTRTNSSHRINSLLEDVLFNTNSKYELSVTYTATNYWTLY